jgi:hypothetical protein
MRHNKCIEDSSLKTRMEDLHAEEGILLKWFFIRVSGCEFDSSD